MWACTRGPWSSSKTRAISSTLNWARLCKSVRLGESLTCRVSSRQRTQLRTATPPACFRAASPAAMTGKGSVGDADYQKLLTKLAEIDKAGANPQTEPSAATSAKRARSLLEQLAAKSPNSEDRVMWTRQLADTCCSASVQSGTFSEGMTRLDRLVAQWEKQAEQKDLAVYVSFRRLTAAYAAGLQDEKADPRQVQAERTKSLEAFVDSFPDSEDKPEAMLQRESARNSPDKCSRQRDELVSELAERFAKSSPAEKARRTSGGCNPRPSRSLSAPARCRGPAWT